MNKKTPLHIAIAACSFLLTQGDSNLITIQVTPAGYFKPIDGRPLECGQWYIDAASAQQVINRFNARVNPVVIDYEHQTLNKEINGQKAPAAAWFKSLEWRPEGLFAQIELTANARQAINDKEYLYFSPVFHYNKITGEVMQIEMGAITNTPAVHGMEALSLRAAACFGAYSDNEEPSMNKLLLAMCTFLGMATTSNEDEVLAALTAHQAKDPLKPVKDVLGVAANTDEKTLVAACAAMKANQGQIDPAKFVPVTVVDGLRTEMAALSARLGERDSKDVDVMIAEALKDGRLFKAEEEHYRGWAAKDLAACTAALNARPKIPGLSGGQTNGKDPVVTDASGLNETELAVCSAMGIAPEDFKKVKAAA